MWRLCVLTASSDLYSPPAEIFHHLWLCSHLSPRCTSVGKIIARQMKLCSQANVLNPLHTNTTYLSASLSLFFLSLSHSRSLPTRRVSGSACLPFTYKIHPHPMLKSITCRQGEVTHAITENYVIYQLIYFWGSEVVKPVWLSAASTANYFIIDEITDVTLANR